MKLFSKLSVGRKAEGLNPDALRRATAIERRADKRTLAEAGDQPPGHLHVQVTRPFTGTPK